MTQARFVEAARREILAEVTYYQEVQIELATKFLESVEQATARALAYSMTGPPGAKGTRRVFLKDFPFALFYRPNDQGIIVIALAHHARRPGYWRDRTEGR
ncbi:MAG: type II toxin-antitoxin system RelE/ParE family toxin [Synechococcaceae cyanobacterium]|nr:type II toxin-antitoxin system RelE/ParE family toxin [Synechococcaceae cyanobacterium]